MLKFDDVGTGRPVLLIHGFPLCRRMWRPQVAALRGAGCRVLCPDLPGFGETPAMPDRPAMAGYTDAVITLLDEVGVEQAVVGGMSMGGYVLLDLLDRYPQRVSAALFLLTRAAADDAPGRQKRTELIEEVRRGNRLIVPETFAQVLFAPQAVDRRPELVAEVREWMELTSPAGVVAGLQAMRDREDYIERLPEFDLPALVVGAEDDQAIPFEHAEILAAGLPNATLKIIPAAGHMANLEQPERFNRVVLEFLAGLN